MALHDLTSDEIIESLTPGLEVSVGFFLKGLSVDVIEKRREEIKKELQNQDEPI